MRNPKLEKLGFQERRTSPALSVMSARRGQLPTKAEIGRREDFGWTGASPLIRQRGQRTSRVRPFLLIFLFVWSSGPCWRGAPS